MRLVRVCNLVFLSIILYTKRGWGGIGAGQRKIVKDLFREERDLISNPKIEICGLWRVKQAVILRHCIILRKVTISFSSYATTPYHKQHRHHLLRRAVVFQASMLQSRRHLFCRNVVVQALISGILLQPLGINVRININKCLVYFPFFLL